MCYRIILLIFFLILPIDTFAGNKLNEELLKEIEAQYPKSYIIKKDDFSPNVKKYNKNLQTFISGDFDCNNMKDYVFQIYHDGAVKLIAIHRFKDGSNKIIEVSKAGELSSELLKGHHEMGVSLRKKGQKIEFYCDCENDDKEEQNLCNKYADKKSLRGCSLRLKCDAIEWLYVEKGAELFYFDIENNNYLSVITAD